MKIILAGTLESIKTRVDGSISISYACNEIDSTEAGRLFQLRGRYCKALLSDTNITEMESKLIDEEVMKDGRKVKSHSQRLRSVLFRLHENIQSHQDFDEFYREKMEGLIEHFKQKLD